MAAEISLPSSVVTTEEDAAGWKIRAAFSSANPYAVEVSMLANSKLRQQYVMIHYALSAIIVLTAAFLPLPDAVTQVLADARLQLAQYAVEFITSVTDTTAPVISAEAHSWLTILLQLFLRLVFALAASKLVPNFVVQESMLVIRNLGIQLKSVTSSGSSSYQFIDASSVKSIIINEGIQSCDVRYYLAIVVAGRKTLVLAFDGSRPRLPVLSRIYRTVHTVMFPEQHVDDDYYASLAK